MAKQQEISFTKGLTFTFTDDQREIRVWYSSFAGLEKIFVDGELISKKRNFSMASDTEFTVGETNYLVRFDVESLLHGPCVCTLLKNYVEFKRQTLIFPDEEKGQTGKRKPNFFVQLILYIIFGGLIGFILGTLDVPRNWFYMIIALMVVVIIVREIRKASKTKPYIIEEETL